MRVGDKVDLDVGSLNNWSLKIVQLEKTLTINKTESNDVPKTPTRPSTGSNLTISGLESFIYDVDLTTFITNTNTQDLSITLTSPSGTVVVITTGNGDANGNVFNGTTWNDSANQLVTTATFTNNVVKASLVPEGALSAFIGENPNGVWTLSTAERFKGEAAILENWSLSIVSGPSLIGNCFALQSVIIYFFCSVLIF